MWHGPPTDRDITQKRDKHYGFINYTSALAADVVLFNSQYHLDSFLAELPRLLKHFPDYNEPDTVEQIAAKSSILPLGLDLETFNRHKPIKDGQASKIDVPLLIWGHRWEYDKGPKEFFRALTILSERGLEFELAVLGESFSQKPGVFLEAERTLAKHIVQFGYVGSFGDYAQWLWRADIVPVTSNQDFFGASVVEALYCDCFPLLPKRLAYPYLIPPEYYAECFYEDFDDLLDRLTGAITNIEQTRQSSLRSVVAQYDWQEQSKLYDTLFLDLVSNR